MLIKYRFFQFFRFLKELGFLHSAYFLIILISTFVLPVYTSRKNENGNIINAICILGGFCMLTIFRNDKKFIQLAILNKFRYYFKEYVFLSSPFLLLLIADSDFLILLIYLILLYILIFLFEPFKSENIRSYFKAIKVPINSKNYEWLSGIKMNIIVFIILFFTFFVLQLIVKNQFLVYPFIIITFFIVSSFYLNFEPWAFLSNRGLNSNIFIKQTIIIHLKAFFILISPFCTYHLFFFHGLVDLAIILWIYFATILFTILLVVIKYAIYVPNKYQPLNSIILCIWGIISLIPFALPVVAFSIILYRKKSFQNLKNYLND